MAWRQPHRGNPELKQYHLINDFSGGLDTVSLDEKMRDNEFREMRNIELALQGSISNRKGFGELSHFNQFLEDKNIILPSGKTNFLKVVRNEGNVLVKANDYQTYELYSLFMQVNRYNLKILMSFQVGANVEFKLLNVKNTNGTVGGMTQTLTNLATIAGTLTDVLNVPTVQYVQKTYFITSAAYTTTNPAYKGIGVYNEDDNTLTVINPSNAYTPTPYEVESFGFNVLRASPLLDVATQGSGDYSILGAYITDTSGNYLEKVPTSGNFNLIVLQTGETMSPRHVKVTILDQSLNEIQYTMESQTDGGGYFTYAIRGLNVSATTSVEIKLEPRPLSDIYSAFKLYETSSPAGTQYHFGSMREFNAYTGSQISNVVRENFTLTRVTTTTNYVLSVTAASDTKQEVYRSIRAQLTSFYADPYSTVIRVDVGGSYSYWRTAIVTEYPAVRKFYAMLQGGTNYILSRSTPSDGVDENTLFSVYHSYNTDHYFLYNGGKTMTSADYTQIGAFNEFLPFNSYFEVGSNDEVDSITSLNLDGVNLDQIQDRLILFKGNTMYYSEQFQYDYFPHPNYLMLPLSSTDEITRIYFFRGVHIIFTKESIWRMSGTIGGQDWFVTKVNDFIGCIAPNSVRALNNNLIFLSNQGIYLLTQSYYQEGLENVKKVDNKIGNLPILDPTSYSVMYKDQYWLMLNSANYSAIKYYFNVDKVDGHPFVTDLYKVYPDNIENVDNVLYSLKNGDFYRFDKDYTDFLPRNSLSSEIPNYMYNYRFVTKNDDFGYPTHDKKIKAMYLKVRAGSVAELGVTVFINERAVIDPNTYVTSVNEFGEVVYEREYEPNLVVDPESDLGTFVLGKNTLGESDVQVHKFVIGQKAKNISIAVEQSTNGYFNIEDIGYLFKLGKVKESR